MYHFSPYTTKHQKQLFFLGERLSNFYIGVTNVSPSTDAPSIRPQNYDVCAYYKGEFPHGGTAMIGCTSTVSGRYLIIQLGDRAELSLCEVQVYATG